MEIPKQESRGHKQKTWIYGAVAGALLVLTGVTFAASYVNWGELTGGGFILNISIALLIASLKAFLVLHFFMHVRFESNLIRIFGLIYPLAILLTLIGFIFLDVLLRKIPVPG